MTMVLTILESSKRGSLDGYEEKQGKTNHNQQISFTYVNIVCGKYRKIDHLGAGLPKLFICPMDDMLSHTQ